MITSRGTHNAEDAPPRVAIFGAGIAGLTAAHEFARRGYRVTVYESTSEAGGFFRSARRTADGRTPSEYSWHGIGPWYHNVFDLMKQIPFDTTGDMYDKALSRPIAFGIAPDRGAAAFDDTQVLNIKNMFRMTWLDVVRGSWLMIKTWAANRRTVEDYAHRNAGEQWSRVLSEPCAKAWRSSFGPWIGSDWANVSLHTAGQFFRKQLISKPSHWHRADDQGPAWTHGARSGWLLLRGPSSECWFNRWLKYLKQLSVQFAWEQPLQEFQFDGNRITGARLASGEAVCAEYYVLATTPFAAAEVLARTPALEQLDQLCLFRPLTKGGGHVQVSVRFAFRERIRWPKERIGLIITDSEYDLTMFAQEQAWQPDVDLGKDVQSLWTITACVSNQPGAVYGIPLAHCTKEQFIEEVKTQIYRCQALDLLIREANEGKCLKCFAIHKIEVWHEWQFSPDGIKGPQPKWVNSTTTQPFMPTQATPVPNLMLAGAHTKTEVDVWSIEAAVESGRRAVKVVEPDVHVVPQYKPLWLRALSRVDDLLFALRCPHVLDVGLWGLVIAVITAVAIWAVN